MHEVAEATSGALSHFILAAASFPEVSDGRELCVDGLGVEPAIIQVHDCFLCILLTTKLNIDVADEVVAQVIAHVHLLHLSVLLLHLREHLLEELVVVLLHFHIADGAYKMSTRESQATAATWTVINKDISMDLNIF